MICANKILNDSSTGYSLEQIDEEFNRKMQNTQSIIAEIQYENGKNVTRRICDLSKLNTEYLEKFFEEVRNGAYPLYAFQPALKTKISKYVKIKRNSLKNIVENSVNGVNSMNGMNHGKLEILNGSKDNLNRPNDNGDDCESSHNGNTNCNLDGTDQIIDENGEECQEEEYEEEEYDQEDTQNDYDENRCENCPVDTYEEETRRIEQTEITLKSTTTGQTLIKGIYIDQITDYKMPRR